MSHRTILTLLGCCALAVVVTHHVVTSANIAPPSAEHGSVRRAVAIRPTRSAHGVAEFSRALSAACRTPRPAMDCPDTAVLAVLTSASIETCLTLLDQLETTAPPEFRERWRHALFTRLAELDPRGAADLALTLRNAGPREAMLRLAAEIWMQRDAAATARWLQTCDHVVREELLASTLSQWSDRDFEGALAWTTSLDDPMREQLLTQLSYQWIRTDPKGAFEFATQLPSATHQLLGTVVSEFARGDPVTIARWLVALSEHPARESLLTSALAVWALATPDEAIAFAASCPADLRGAAIRSVVSNWSFSDPDAAAQWISQMPAGATRQEAVEQLLANWTRSDPAAAAEWLLGSSAVCPGDPSLDALCGALTENTPRIALTFAAVISDEAVRRSRVERIARDWLAADPGAALSGLRAANVSEHLLSKLLANIP